MAVRDVEAVCRCEAQRVLTALRANRKFADLSRGWREFEEDSPIRQLSEWRCGNEATSVALLQSLLSIVRSPDFSGPATYAALEAVHAVVTALCEERQEGAPADPGLSRVLAEVSDAACGCVFAETHPQTDEAATMQMIALLSLCGTVRACREKDEAASAAAFPAEARMRSITKILKLWTHYSRSPTLRFGAQSALQRILDFACSNLEEHAQLLSLVLESFLADVGPELPMDRVVLYLRCLQRIATHPEAQHCIARASPHSSIFYDTVPVILLAVGLRFGTNISVLALLLPIVNRICWLSIANWEEDASNRLTQLGSLQVEALLSSIYIRIMTQAVVPLQASDNAVLPITLEEGTELLVVLLEGLCDLLQPGVVRTLWYSFDVDWRRPPLLQELLRSVAVLFADSHSTHVAERPLPAYLVHLSSTALLHVVTAFAEGCPSLGRLPGSGAEDADGASRTGEAAALRIRQQLGRRQAVRQLLAKIEKSPKKTRATLDASGVLDFIDIPPARCCPENGALLPSTTAADVEFSIPESFDEWARKLAWVFRCWNHGVSYAAMGEFFGQPTDDAGHAFAAFADTFDWGNVDMEEALRSFLQAFLLPKEAQQIDRVLKIFAHTYYKKHVEQCRSSGQSGTVYLRHPDAAYTLAFSVIMLNTDQHNPRLKRRMALEDFLRNNRGINEGEDVPRDVQTRIFESIRRDEITTPSTGSLSVSEGVSRSRFSDLLQLVVIGFRDNSLAAVHPDLGAHACSFLEAVGDSLRTALECALAADPGGRSDAAPGLEELLRLALRHRRSEADGLAESLFFFGMEVFHEPQHRGPPGRSSICFRGLFRTVLAQLSRASTRQLHMLVYITIQFALYGLIERTAMPPLDEAVARLLRTPSLVVDPPTGVVYGFLRKISTVPFRMLSFTEGGVSGGPDRVPAPYVVPPLQQPPAAAVDTAGGRAAPLAREEAEGVEGGGGGGAPSQPLPPPDHAAEEADKVETEQSPSSSPPEGHPDETSLQNDPLRSQIEKTFEACGLDTFIHSLVSLRAEAPAPKHPTQPVGADTATASHALLSYLSSIFVALRGSSKVTKDMDLPFFFDQDLMPEIAAPQPLQLPKRALPLNVLDGYETLRFAMRLTLCIVCQTCRDGVVSPQDVAAMQELSVSIHVGLFHTMRRTDLCERTLRIGIVCIFQIASALLALRSVQGPVVSLGWPIGLIDVLINRSESEPQLLVTVAKLCLGSVRLFVTEVSKSRQLDRLELWQKIMRVLVKAVPTSARALWSGTKDGLVEAAQRDLFSRGIVWLLGHPCLMDCLGSAEVIGGGGGDGGEVGAAEKAAGAGGAHPEKITASSFWNWALTETVELVLELAPGSRQESARLLIEAYKELLGHIISNHDPVDYAVLDEQVPEQERPVASAWGESCSAVGPAATVEPAAASVVAHADSKRLAAQAAAWSRVMFSLLANIGPLLSRGAASNGQDQPLVQLLKHTMLNVRVAPLLCATAHGPHWARVTLEKLVTVLTSAASSDTPIPVLREAVPLVAKFFLQNLHALQRHSCFGQLWLMVLRLMLTLVKRGHDDRDAELEEIATETLKNLLCVLLNTNSLGFVPPKGVATTQGSPAQDFSGTGQGPPVWWKMTWDSIEVFLPGFIPDFTRSMFPGGEGGGGAKEEAAPASCAAGAPLAVAAASTPPGAGDAVALPQGMPKTEEPLGGADAAEAVSGRGDPANVVDQGSAASEMPEEPKIRGDAAGAGSSCGDGEVAAAPAAGAAGVCIVVDVADANSVAMPVAIAPCNLTSQPPADTETSYQLDGSDIGDLGNAVDLTSEATHVVEAVPPVVVALAEEPAPTDSAL